MTPANPETRPFQAEIRKLLDILIHSLYTDREIFLRELISNASDALHRVKFEMLTNHDVRDAEIDLAIRIQGDAQNRTLMVADTGIGMTHDELVENLGTIARSGAEAFVASLEAGKSIDQIGQFGVGFYSVFMVAEEVHVTSLSYRPDATPWTWISRGADSYELQPAEKAERGTTIEITLKEDAGEFAEAYRLRDIVRRHSDFVSFPIYVGEEAANRQTALWRRTAAEVTDEAANEFYKQLTYDFEEPMLRIQAHTDAPVQIYALLFVPSRLDRGALSVRQDFGLKLYSRKIRIQDYNKDLLPNYLRFVEGVVDSDDLALNVSRETVQASPVMRRIQRVLTNRVLDALKDLAANDADRYTTFWKEFGLFLKEGAAMEYADRERLLPLLRFYTSRSDGKLASLNDYVSRMAMNQRAIYYIVGDGLAAVQHSPHLDYFRVEKLEVLYLVDPLDGFLPSALGEYEGFPLKNVDDAGLELPGKKEEEEAAGEIAAPIAAVIERFKTQLGERIVDVRSSSRLVGSPARLVTPQGAPGSEMARVRRMLDKDFEAPKKLLEINPHHPLIANLAALIANGDRQEVVEAAVEQVYENGLLLEGIHPNPANMVERIQRLLEAATAA